MKIKDIPEAVLSACREREMSDEMIELSSPRELFDEYCMWHGIVNWSSTLWAQVEGLMKAAEK